MCYLASIPLAGVPISLCRRCFLFVGRSAKAESRFSGGGPAAKDLPPYKPAAINFRPTKVVFALAVNAATTERRPPAPPHRTS
jgi:hypothetical protein